MPFLQLRLTVDARQIHSLSLLSTTQPFHHTENALIADVKKPIIGADFLRYFGLMVDMNKWKLVDTNNQQCILSMDTSPRPSLCLDDSNNPISNCCWSSPPSLKPPHQTLQSSMKLSTTLRPQGHLSQPVPDVLHLTASKPPRGNSSTCSN